LFLRGLVCELWLAFGLRWGRRLLLGLRDGLALVAGVSRLLRLRKVGCFGFRLILRSLLYGLRLISCVGYLRLGLFPRLGRLGLRALFGGQLVSGIRGLLLLGRLRRVVGFGFRVVLGSLLFGLRLGLCSNVGRFGSGLLQRLGRLGLLGWVGMGGGFS